MFVFIWASLILSVRGSHAYTGTGTYVAQQTSCDKGFCITLPEELTAEAGLCVVIPCSFRKTFSFTPLYAVWYKCSETKRRCGDTDIIFHSNNYNRKAQPGFRNRVSLLEPALSSLNCSIIINDLQDSDSGAYQFRINSFSDGFQFTPKALISVKDLHQKPTVEIPPLQEGREATLTCTAPGLCSGSVPTIIWTWCGAGGSISGNITTFKTENLNAIANRYSSTLTFNTSAEHHSTNITCKINFSKDVTTEESVILNVTYIKELKVTGDASVKEHETLNLTCSVESFPPSQITWMKYSDQIVQNGTETILKEAETSQQGITAMGFLFISNTTKGDSGEYRCIAVHLNKTIIKEINVTVLYRRNLQITGNTRVTDGYVLNLTCSAESLPPSLIVWTKLGRNTTLNNDTGSASLVIPNVTVEDSGQYACTGIYQGTATTAHVDVAVTYIHRRSRCELQSKVLTCVCISEGFPLPTIKWPLLNNHTEYSIITAVSKHTVNSTVTLTVQTKGNTTVECVSGNENGEVTKSLPIEMKLSGKDDPAILKAISRVEIIIAFLIGVLLSAIISYLVMKCYRRKQKNSGNVDETVELVTNNNSLLYDGPALEDDHLYDQEEADDGKVAADKTSPELDSDLNDVEYANIDFSLLKRKSPEDGEREDESTKTEYAEIKKEVKEEGEESGMLKDKEEEVVKEVEETRCCLPEEETAEMEAVYSNVKEVMNEI